MRAFFSASGDDQVGVLDVIADVLLVHRLHGRQILLGNTVDFAPALHNIALHAAQKADVRVHADENAEIHHRAQTLVVKRVNALNDHRLRGFNHFPAHVRAAMLRVVVGLAGNRATLGQQLHVIQKLIVLEHTRLVVVNLRALLKREIRMVAIIRVLIDQHHASGNFAGQILRQRGLPAAARAADSDQKHRRSPPLRLRIPRRGRSSQASSPHSARPPARAGSASR